MELKDYTNNALVIEQQPLAQSHLKYSLRAIGFKQVDFVDRSYLALKAIENKHYDLIICSSELNSDADGYQLFEQLVAEKRVKPSSCFVFLSSTQNLAHAQSIVELKPDDVVQKPYSAMDIEKRLLKVLNKKARFYDVFKEVDNNNMQAANQALNDYIAENKTGRWVAYLMKLKGELILLMQQWGIGMQFFAKVLNIHPYTWAEVGQVECFLQLELFDEAKHKLEFMLKKHNTKLPAHDMLTRLFKHNKEYQAAAEHLKSAIKLSPRNLTRMKELVELSRLLHDFESLYTASNTLARHSKHSLHYNPGYYLSAIRANIDYAYTLLDEEESRKLAHQSQSMLSLFKKNHPSLATNTAIDVTQARIYNLREEKNKAKRLLTPLLEHRPNKEQEHSSETGSLDNFEHTLEQAKALHEVGFYNESEQVFEQLVEYSQQNYCSDITRQYILEEQQLRKDIKDSPKELNNQAVAYHDKGNYSLALRAFEMAFRLMPKSSSIALNLMQTAIESDLISSDEKRLKQIISRCHQSISTPKLNAEQLARYDKLNEILSDKNVMQQ